MRAKLLLSRQPRLYEWTHRGHALLRYLLRKPHEPDFAAFRKFPDRQGIFLDVGANIGQSAMSFRLFNRTTAILSVEANPLLERDLRRVRRIVRGFDYKMCAAGAEPGTATLHIPTYRGLPLTGEASVNAHEALEGWWTQQQGVSDANNHVKLQTVEVESVRLDDLSLTPAFVKVDVEGFELEVLRGLAATLAAHKPIVLVERPENPELPRFLAEFGYSAFSYRPSSDSFESDVGGLTQNVFFLPADVAAQAVAAH